VERGDGHLPAVRAKGKTGRLSSSRQLADISDECVMPAHLAVGTREGYQSFWKSVITWAIAHDEVGSILPMTQTTLKAITQELMMIGCATGTIRNVWSAIEDRHRRYGYPLPLGMQGDFSRMSRAVASVQGQPSRLIFFIGTHHVKDMLELAGLTESQTRDMLMYVLGTVACFRVGEVDQLQVCDLSWSHERPGTPATIILWLCEYTSGSRTRSARASTRVSAKRSLCVYVVLLAVSAWGYPPIAASSGAPVRGAGNARLCFLAWQGSPPLTSRCLANRLPGQ